MTVLNKAKHTIEKYKLFTGGERVIISFSGGPDSVCLLHVLGRFRNDFNLTLYALYIDHGLRPQEIPQEIQFCRELCGKLDITFGVKKIDILSSPLVAKLGKQAAARELRYETLREEALHLNFSRIALGHTRNDNAETLVINFIRGTGMHGLTGIPPVRGNIVRPLVDVSREEILQYLESNSLTFVQDSSNLTMDYLRNKVRLQIIPELKKTNPSLIDVLSRTADILRQEDEYLEVTVTKTLMRLISRKTPSRIELFLLPLETMPVVMIRRVLRRAMAEIKDLHAISYQNIEDMISLIKTGNPGDRIILPKNLRAVRDYSVLVLTTEEPRKLAVYELPPRGEVFVREASIILASSVMELPPAADGKTSAVFDAGKIRFPLVIRARKQGDFFIPAGFGKKTKIQDFFVNNKIPRDERDVVPLVCSGDNVMWIYGYRIDQRFLPDNHTREYLVIASRSAKK